MLAAVTGFVAMLPSMLQPDSVGMMSGAVYDDDGSVPCSGGNSITRGLTALDDVNVDDGDVTLAFNRSQFPAVTLIH